MKTCSLCHQQIKDNQLFLAHNKRAGIKKTVWDFAHVYCIEQNWLEVHRIIPQIIQEIGQRVKRSFR